MQSLQPRQPGIERGQGRQDHLSTKDAKEREGKTSIRE
jgi:hypothetical protein